jgi:hypothetical protein
MLRSHHLRFIKHIYALYVVGSCTCGVARAGGMPVGVRVGVDGEWHSVRVAAPMFCGTLVVCRWVCAWGWMVSGTLWGSLLLCSVARCLGVGTCSQVDYPGMFGCMRGLVVSS